MAEFERDAIQLDGGVGLDITSPSNALPDGAYSRLTNVEIDKETGFMRVRRAAPVFATVDTTRSLNSLEVILGQGAATSNQYIKGDQGTSASTAVYRNTTLISTAPLPSNSRASILSYQIGLSTSIWALILDNTRPLKDNGTLTYNLGITAPTVTPTVTAVAGALTLTATWGYTYYNSTTGQESAMSPISASTSLTAQNAQVAVTASTDTQVDTINLYRKGGTLTSGYFRVLSASNTTATLTDSVVDGNLGVFFDQVNRINMPKGSQGAIWNDRLWIVSTNGQIYYSNRINIEHFNVNNFIPPPIGDTLSNLVVHEEQLLVLGQKSIYRIQGLGGEIFGMTRLPIDQALFGQWVFSVSPGLLLYRAFDGIYALRGLASVNISRSLDPIFNGRSSDSLQPIDHTRAATERMISYSNKIWWAYFDTTGVQRVLQYDPAKNRWQDNTYPFNIMAFAIDAKTGLLYASTDKGKVVKLYDPATLATTDDTATGTVAATFLTGRRNQNAAEQDKYYNDVVIETDTKGVATTLSIFFNEDTVAYQTANIQTWIRQQTIVPINPSSGGYLARTIRLQYDMTNGPVGAPEVYRLFTHFLRGEPEFQLTRASGWTDLGTPTQKYLRQLVVELDTQGQPTDLIVEFDQ